MIPQGLKSVNNYYSIYKFLFYRANAKLSFMSNFTLTRIKIMKKKNKMTLTKECPQIEPSSRSLRCSPVMQSWPFVDKTPRLNLRWLDWIFLGGYLPSLSINYVAMIKDMEKRLPQLYYIKMKISFDLGFIAIGVAMAT